MGIISEIISLTGEILHIAMLNMTAIVRTAYIVSKTLKLRKKK